MRKLPVYIGTVLLSAGLGIGADIFMNVMPVKNELNQYQHLGYARDGVNKAIRHMPTDYKFNEQKQQLEETKQKLEQARDKLDADNHGALSKADKYDNLVIPAESGVVMGCFSLYFAFKKRKT